MTVLSPSVAIHTVDLEMLVHRRVIEADTIIVSRVEGCRPSVGEKRVEQGQRDGSEALCRVCWPGGM